MKVGYEKSGAAASRRVSCSHEAAALAFCFEHFLLIID